MKVGDICTRTVVTIAEFEDLMAAAHLMRKKHVGYLVVVEPRLDDGTVTPVGVITDRDIVVKVLAQETDARSLRVGDVMTRQPVITREESSVAVALHYMREIGVRRMPVVNQAGRLVGVLSLDDFLDALAEELTDVAGSIRHELKAESALSP